MKKILLTTTMLVGFAVAANATEAGKMYVRGDLGYQISKYSDLSTKHTPKGFAGDVGFGYAISDSFRTDVTLNFSKPSKKWAGLQVANDEDWNTLYTKMNGEAAKKAAAGNTLINTNIKFKESKMGVMFNGYYDINTGSAFTPYVMAGIGYNRGSVTLTTSANVITKTAVIADNTTNPPTTATPAVTENQSFSTKSKTLNSFGYQVGLGVGYEMSKDIVLDVGYKLSGTTGTYKAKDSTTLVKPARVAHNFTAGVRFAF
jgi:opacity protein-like surface antigen